jgi:MFS transporter, SHS family, lactate transporter
VWLENRRQQRLQRREVRAPFIKIFQRGMIANTLNACWWMASGFVNNYSVVALFPSYLQKDLHLSPGLVALPVMLQNAVFFASSLGWGVISDRFGRRWAVMIPAILSIPCAPLYLLTGNYTMIVVFFALQGAFAIGMTCQNPSYLSERFPTEVRATASGFCYHQGAIFGGLVAPVLAYCAGSWQTGFAIPMLVGTVFGAVSFILATLLGPETRGKELVPDLSVA